MMIMTIWWSKATRLLEFSHFVSLDLRTRIFCDEEDKEEELRILVVGLYTHVVCGVHNNHQECIKNFLFGQKSNQKS